MGFCRGDLVEVASKEEGFVGSYYPATVIAELIKKDYIVQYETLLKDDKSGPLREIVTAAELRPLPPPVTAASYGLYDRVDVYANDGWWVGKVTGRQGFKYYVYFETTGDEIDYPVNHLRVHQEWVNGKWVPANRRGQK